jgi:hypothetical protein
VAIAHSEHVLEVDVEGVATLRERLRDVALGAIVVRLQGDLGAGTGATCPPAQQVVAGDLGFLDEGLAGQGAEGEIAVVPRPLAV